jgi:signal transduction histidine kinase
MDTSMTEATRSLLRVADKELQRLSHIAARSLKFYRQRTAPSLTSIEELIESVLFFHETEIKLRTIELIRDYRPAPQVLCLAGEIQQVLTNLISNALEALGDHARMYLRVRPGVDGRGRAGVTISIADSGSGMDRYTMNRLFHPFVTTKGESGTGLGLWVSKGILDKHGATIAVRSKKAKGTVFRILIPLDAGVTHPDPLASSR